MLNAVWLWQEQSSIKCITLITEMEESAFEHQARQWRQKALSVSRSCGADETEAEDIAQDVMLRLWQMRNELDRYRSVEAMAAVMARHLTRDLQRRLRTEQLNEAAVTTLSTGPHELLEAKEDVEWLERRIGQLPTTQHTLLYMRQVERRSHKELSQLLGISEASVSTLLARARRTLLEEIKQRNRQ